MTLEVGCVSNFYDHNWLGNVWFYELEVHHDERTKYLRVQIIQSKFSGSSHPHCSNEI